MSAFLYRMPSGIPGALSRPGAPVTVEPNVILSTNPPTAYGNPVAVDAASGHVRPIGAGDTAASVYGFLVRPFPIESGTTALGTATPPTSGACDVAKLGYMTVKVTNGTPAKNSAVYIRTVLNGAIPAGLVGDVEAVADGTNTFVLPGAYFTGAADANGNSEIAFNLI
jgi:hypothetical protein